MSRHGPKEIRRLQRIADGWSFTFSDKSSPIGTKLPTAVHALGVYTAADGVTALPKPGVRNSLETSVVTTERTPSEALKLKLEEKKNNTAVRDGLNRPWPS